MNPPSLSIPDQYYIWVVGVHERNRPMRGCFWCLCVDRQTDGRTDGRTDRQTDRQACRRPDGPVETRRWSQPEPPNDRVTQTENKEGEEKEKHCHSRPPTSAPLNLCWPLSQLASPLPFSLRFHTPSIQTLSLTFLSTLAPSSVLRPAWP